MPAVRQFQYVCALARARPCLGAHDGGTCPVLLLLVRDLISPRGFLRSTAVACAGVHAHVLSRLRVCMRG